MLYRKQAEKVKRPHAASQRWGGNDVQGRRHSVYRELARIPGRSRARKD